MTAEAEVDGMSTSLIPRLLIENELKRGVLVLVTSHKYRSGHPYYMICPERKSENTALTALRVWIEEEASTYRQAMGLGD